MSSSSKSEKVYPLSCPICSIPTNYIYGINDSKGNTSRWYKCTCGVIFQDKTPVPIDKEKDEPLDNAYALNTHSARTYAPIIESLDDGRELLDVGCGNLDNMDYFKKRGWVCTGIDVDHSIKDIIHDDFCSYNFNVGLTKEQLDTLGDVDTTKKFDTIWMGHVIHQLGDPLKGIQKAYNLLTERGVLYISTPDIDFITKSGIASWGHFVKNENYILWSERALVRELERIGFNIIMKRRNYSQRFGYMYDVHVIAEKRYY